MYGPVLSKVLEDTLFLVLLHTIPYNIELLELQCTISQWIIKIIMGLIVRGNKTYGEFVP